MALWENIVLCTIDDIENRVGDLRGITQITDTDLYEQTINQKIDETKRSFRRELLTQLQPIFSTTIRSLGIPESTYSLSDYASYLSGVNTAYTDTDSMLDTLDNPEELLDAAVSSTVVRVLLTAQSMYNASWHESPESYNDLIKTWQCIAKDEFSCAVKLLRFDIDKDGIISPNERVITRRLKKRRT